MSVSARGRRRRFRDRTAHGVAIRFQSLQWQMAYSYGVTSIGILLLAGGISVMTSRWSQSEGNLLKGALAIVALIVLGLLGALQGFRTGRELKRRLDVLNSMARSITSDDFEKYDDGTRIVQDELDEVGERWNEVVIRLTNQVTSMQQLINRNQELSDKTSQIAVLEERQRLARELHDSVSQQLFAVSLTAATLVRQMGKVRVRLDADNGEAKSVLLDPLLSQANELEELSNQTQREMRALMLHLRPVELDGKSLHVALNEFLREVETRIPMIYRWDIGDLGNIPSGIEDQLFRIIQEAMSNAIRHSDATHIDLYLHREGQNVYFQLQDDGRGFNAKDQKAISYGLKTMKERTEQLGGRLTMTSAASMGTRVLAHIPILVGFAADRGDAH